MRINTLATSVIGTISLIAAALLPTSAMSAPPAPMEPDTCQNVALNKPVTASGRETQDRFGPELAVDGDTGPANKATPSVHNAPGASRWSANNADNAWIEINFQGEATLNEVRVHWGNTFGKPYQLLGSADGVSWTPLTEQVNGQKAAMVSHPITTTGPIRYLKLQISGKSQQWALSIWEIEACGTVVPDPVADAVNIIPKPVSAAFDADGAPFILSESASIAAVGAGLGPAKILAEQLRAATGFKLPITDTQSDGGITITIDPAAEAVAGVSEARQNEAYVLTVGDQGVEIVARDRLGALWGVQSLLQLFGPWATFNQVTAGPFTAPAVTIADGPRFEWRGFMLDPVRSFYPVDEVEAMIDQLSRYKMNVLHMHLTDDQGWRLQMELNDDAYDEGLKALTEVSGQTSYMAGKSDWARDSAGRTGYYTIEDFAHMVQYAAERGITVVPELDGPGHATSMLHAIPELNTENTFPKPPDGKNVPDPFDEGSFAKTALDPMHEPTYEYLSRMIASMANQAGPNNHYFHIGGDESTTTTHDTYRVYMEKVMKIVADNGKAPMVWNEALGAAGDLLPNNAVVQWWTGDPKGGGNAPKVKAFADRGGNFLVSPARHTYYPQRESTAVGGPTWACRLTGCTLRIAYDWDPVSYMGVGEDHVLGVEGALWSEHLRTDHDMQFLVFPRMLAHAEVGWTPNRLKDFSDFSKRVAIEGNALNADDITFHYGPLVDWQMAATGVTHVGDNAVVAGALNVTEEEVLLGYISAPGQALDTVKVNATIPAEDGAGAGTPVGVELRQEKAFHFTDPDRTTGRQMGSIIEVWAKPGIPAGTQVVNLAVSSALGETSAKSTVEVTPAPVYDVTVVNGSADLAQASTGTTVTVTANVPAHKVFQKWSADVDGVVFADATATTTTFTMPAGPVTITAELADEAQYQVVVTGGRADVTETYAGETVTVVADENTAPGKEFAGWTADHEDVVFADANASQTTFMMPAADVHITAQWKDTPVVVQPELEVIAGSDGLAYNEVYQGDNVTLTARGFNPNEDITFVMHSDPVKLGVETASDSGLATLMAAVPADAALGEHTVVATQGDLSAQTVIIVKAKDEGEGPKPKPDPEPKPDPAPKPDPNKPGTDAPDKPGTPVDKDTPGDKGKPTKPVTPGDPGKMPSTGADLGALGIAGVLFAAGATVLVARRRQS